MMEFPLIMEVRMKVRVFWSDKNKNIPRKKIARLLNEKSSIHFELSKKQVLSRSIKAAIIRCFLK